MEAYYAYSDAVVKPYGLFDPNGTFYNAQNAGIIESPRGSRYGLYLDDTDNRRDPRIGYRFQYEKWGQLSSRAGNSEYYQEDYNLTGYIPVLAEDKGVLVLNQFFDSSAVLKKAQLIKVSMFVITQQNPDVKQFSMNFIPARLPKLKTAKQRHLAVPTACGGILQIAYMTATQIFGVWNFAGMCMKRRMPSTIFWKRGHLRDFSWPSSMKMEQSLRIRAVYGKICARLTAPAQDFFLILSLSESTVDSARREDKLHFLSVILFSYDHSSLIKKLCIIYSEIYINPK